jgi:hypothetical protein
VVVNLIHVEECFVHPETSKGQKAMEPPAKKALPREVMALRSMGPDDN